MAILNTRVVSFVTMAVLIAGIVAAIVFLWIPRLGGELSARPEPPMPFWKGASSQKLTASAAFADFAVHDIVASPRHVTLVYSIKLVGDASREQEATIGSRATLVGSNGDVHKALRTQQLATAEGVTLGAITFEAEVGWKK